METTDQLVYHSFCPFCHQKTKDKKKAALPGGFPEFLNFQTTQVIFPAKT
jgi:hypothetical protein